MAHLLSTDGLNFNVYLIFLNCQIVMHFWCNYLNDPELDDDSKSY